MVEDRHIITSQRAIHGHYLRARFLQFNPTSLVLCVLVASFWEIVGQAPINRSFHDLRIVEASNISSVVSGSCKKWQTSENGCFPFLLPVKDNETFFMKGCYCGLPPPISAGRRPVWDPDAGNIDSIPCKPDTYRPESTFRADDPTKTLCIQKRSCDGKGEIRVPGSSLTEDDTTCECQDEYQRVDGSCVLIVTSDPPTMTSPTTPAVRDQGSQCWDVLGWGMLGVVIFSVPTLIVTLVKCGAWAMRAKRKLRGYTCKQFRILIAVSVLVSFLLVALFSRINALTCIVEKGLGPVFIIVGLVVEVIVFLLLYMLYACFFRLAFFFSIREYVLWPIQSSKGKKSLDKTDVDDSNQTGNCGVAEDVILGQAVQNRRGNLQSQAQHPDEAMPLTQSGETDLSGIKDDDDIFPRSGETQVTQKDRIQSIH